MGIADFFSDLYSSMGFPEAHADAPPEDKEDDDSEEGGDDDKAEGEGDEKDEGGDEEGGEAGGDEEGGEEEPEEEEEEPVDPKPKLEEGEFAGAIYFQFRFNLRLTLLCFFYRLCPLRAVLRLETPLRGVRRARNVPARTPRPVQGT
jgi:hypothetical protein